MPRELGEFPPEVAQLILRLPAKQRWQIIEALEDLCADPYLLAVQEELGEQYIIVAGFAISLDIDDATITVVDIYRRDPN